MTKHLYDEVAKRFYHGGRIFFYSDPHFSDINSYTFRFPEVFKEDNMNRILLGKILGKEKYDSFFNDCVNILDQMQIDNINAVCTKNDSLIILGDIGNIDCIKKLKAGYKVLILGNHDKGASNYKRKQEVVSIDNISIDLYKGKDIEVDTEGIRTTILDNKSSIKFEDNHLFDEVYEGPLFISEKILLSHEPVDLPFAYNIHGHVHDKNYKPNGINCCAECINYKPICLSDIVASGRLNKIQTIHRTTIDIATKNKKHRNKQSRDPTK